MIQTGRYKKRTWYIYIYIYSSCFRRQIVVRYGRAIHLKLRSVWTHYWRYRTAIVHGYATFYLSECRSNLYVTPLSPGVLEWHWLGFMVVSQLFDPAMNLLKPRIPSTHTNAIRGGFDIQMFAADIIWWLRLDGIYSDRRFGRIMKGPVSDEDGGLLIRPMAIGMRVPTMIRWDKGVGEICIRAGPIGRNTEWSGETKPVVAFLAGQGTSRYL